METTTTQADERATTFVREHAGACGGNWTVMLMSAIRHGLPHVWGTMENREYTFVELWGIITAHV